jgi:hypothetical protein
MHGMRRALMLVVALLAAGCAGGGGNGAPSAPDPALKMTPKQRFAEAKPQVAKYLTALATDQPLVAQQLAGSDAEGFDEPSLSDLRAWFARLPIGQLKVTAGPYKVDQAGAAGVLVKLQARLRPQPLSQWVDLGQRVMVAAHTPEGWRVIADATNRKGVNVKQQGVALFPEPGVLSGKHSTVIYEAVEANEAARAILSDADDVVPALDQSYARDLAARHPVIFLVRDEKQGEQLSGVKSFRKEVPDGFVLNGVSYIEWIPWSAGDPVERDGTIAHELTHVASWTLLGRSPHSMFEGLAMYHEQKFLHSIGYTLRMSYIKPLYASGQFPSIEIWRRRVTDWGLKNPQAVQACYEDAQAMITVILQRHGGAHGLERLANAFTRMHVTGAQYSAAQVQQAFQQGLGVSFDQVVAEAHAYAASVR